MTVRLRILTVLKVIGGVMLVALAAVLIWAAQPGINRTLKSTNPMPMQTNDDPLPLGVEEKIVQFVDTEAVGTDALVILKSGKTAFAYGPIDVPTNLHSIRKSILSVLYGIAVDKGLVSTESTLSELGIDEPEFPLSVTEKSATLAHLLQARSGVYIPAGGETQRMKDNRPARGQHKPGEFFYYNNWDFNVAGYIFEQETGLLLGEAIDEWLARPLGMEDFHTSHVEYANARSGTMFRFFRIHMSARDLARIGLLVQQQGKWNGEQIIPSNWVQLTTGLHSNADLRGYDGYGYLWWLNKERDVIAGAGTGNQHLHIYKDEPYVLVNRQDTGNSLLGRILFFIFKYSNDPCDLFKIHDIIVATNRATSCAGGDSETGT